jgi:hypothetical protein
MLPKSDKRDTVLSKGLPWLAVVISLIALLFSGLQWRESHSQLLLSMKPSVDFELLDDPDDLPVTINIQNSGPGPAIIKSITYYEDKKVIGDIDKLLNYRDLSTIQKYEYEEGDTLAVGEHHFLLSQKSKPRGKEEKKMLDEFVDLIDHHLAIEVVFCPVLPGDCFTKCSTKGWCK